MEYHQTGNELGEALSTKCCVHPQKFTSLFTSLTRRNFVNHALSKVYLRQEGSILVADLWQGKRRCASHMALK